jgi:hypothetical protein
VAFQITFSNAEEEELLPKFMAAVETIQKASISSTNICTVTNQNVK